MPLIKLAKMQIARLLHYADPFDKNPMVAAAETIDRLCSVIERQDVRLKYLDEKLKETDRVLELAVQLGLVLEEQRDTERAKSKYTTGHCEHHNKPGGCQLHNVQCGYPECDRKKYDL